MWKFIFYLQNTQDQRFLAVEADINQLDDANFALDTRVDSLEITSALHSEQISVLEQSVSLLDEKVTYTVQLYLV